MEKTLATIKAEDVGVFEYLYVIHMRNGHKGE